MAAASATAKIIPPRMNCYIKRLVKGPPFKGNEEMKYEGVRLITFKDWPKWAAVWPTVLAKAGFYYTGTVDQVACFCCNGRLKTWEAGDSPMTEHRRFFPQCRFVTGQDSTNEPLGEASEIPSGSTKSSYYAQLAKGVAADSSRHCSPQAMSRRTVKVPCHGTAGLDEHSGPASFDHSTTAVKGLRKQNACLQYSANNDAPSGGLSMAAGGLSMAIEQLQEMKLESKRLESFANWPTSAYACPENLAKAGLYYFGIADHVRCAFCNVTLRDWKLDVEPMEVHRNSFAVCAFLKDAQAAGNVSVEEEKVNNQQASQNAVANPSPSLGVVSLVEPMSQNYSGEKSRLLSYRRWPRNSNQTAEDLARAGFYYTGIDDSVKCFSCNGTLRNWEMGDDAWTEHARWFPRCNYVRTVKGEAFIRSVQTANSGQTNAMRSANSTASVTQSANTGAHRFPVEPRAVRARMDTTRVRSVLDMGFTRDLVYNVVETRLATIGDDFPNVQSLLEAVFAAEETLPSSSSSQTRNMTSTVTTSRSSELAATSNEAAAATAATASAAVNQTAVSVNSSPRVSGKNQRRRKKNKSGMGNYGTSSNKSSVPATEPSLSLDVKTKEKPATTEDQRLQCKICMDAEAKIVFLPCGHLCSCSMCAPALRNCPICRALIRGTVRVFLS